MNTLLLLLCSIVLMFSSASAQEILQVTGENPHYKLTITRGGKPIGDIEIELFPDIAPKHCKNFDSLVAIGFYDGTAFHRVIPGYMIQGGDPNSRDKARSTWGYGDTSQTTVPAEFSSKSHLRGILSAARLGNNINSATSQFFICVTSVTSWNGQYSVYGQVVKGMEVADNIVNSPRDGSDNPLEKVEMIVEKLAASSVDEMVIATDIKLYPNPASHALRFSTSLNTIAITDVRVTDITGAEYVNMHYAGLPINELHVPVDGLATGVYLLTLTDAQQKVRVLKFVVQ
ncbi:MAG: peptidylprolyl isomerase [Ignavibacteria bacterium]|nr:peptidylprolyl isomerase [Ignavibacteria bacterium]